MKNYLFVFAHIVVFSLHTMDRPTTPPGQMAVSLFASPSPEQKVPSLTPEKFGVPSAIEVPSGDSESEDDRGYLLRYSDEEIEENFDTDSLEDASDFDSDTDFSSNPMTPVNYEEDLNIDDIFDAISPRRLASNHELAVLIHERQQDRAYLADVQRRLEERGNHNTQDE